MSLDPENQNKVKDRLGMAFTFGLGAFIGIASTFFISGNHLFNTNAFLLIFYKQVRVYFSVCDKIC